MTRQFTGRHEVTVPTWKSQFPETNEVSKVKVGVMLVAAYLYTGFQFSADYFLITNKPAA